MTDTNKSGHGTNQGRQRDYNQDSYCCLPEAGLYIVADGVGAHLKGEVASEMVTDIVAAKVTEGLAVPQAMRLANEAIIKAASEDETAANMASTVVVLHLEHCNYEVSWVGDSRAYLWDGNNVRQLTRDHSYVQRMMDAGALSAEEAAVHPQRNVVTQALGAVDNDTLVVDTVCGSLTQGEKILLCCDGLTDEVDDKQLGGIISAGESDQQIVDNLIKAANDNGGSDNITIVLVSAPKDAPARSAARGATVTIDSVALEREVQKLRKPSKLWLFIILALLPLIGLAIFYALQMNRATETNIGGGIGPGLLSPLNQKIPVHNNEMEGLNDILPAAAISATAPPSSSIPRVTEGSAEAVGDPAGSYSVTPVGNDTSPIKVAPNENKLRGQGQSPVVPGLEQMMSGSEYNK